MSIALPVILFYVFAAIAVISAFFAVTQHNPVKCVLFLVVTFFASSVLWLLTEAEFLALILVLVYVGAVMTLFLFVVMMLNIDTELLKSRFNKLMPLGLLVIALMISLLNMSMPKSYMVNVETITNNAVETVSNTERLGMVLYTDYFYGFELAAVLLLLAIVSAITLVQRTRGNTKQQNVVKQLLVNKSDRLTIVKLSSSKKGR